jgi:hypothetical protein
MEVTEYKNTFLEALSPAVLISNSNIVDESGLTDRPHFYWPVRTKRHT